jgi:hypothetical protein
VKVNDLVPDRLRLIPGVTVLEHPWRAPRHICSSTAGVFGALAETGADTLCTIFHTCHREYAALERHGGFVVRNGRGDRLRPPRRAGVAAAAGGVAVASQPASPIRRSTAAP